MYPPNAKVARLVDAASEPVDLALAKQYCRVEISDDDALITLMIKAARWKCEQIADRSFINTQWRYTIDFLAQSSGPNSQYVFGGGYDRAASHDGSLWLPYPPLLTVDSISYVDMAGSVASIDPTPSAGSVIVSPGTPGKIFPGYGRFYPLSQPRAAAVTIDYTAGYGPDATSVPPTIILALLASVSFMYDNRNPSVDIPEFIVSMLEVSKWS